MERLFEGDRVGYMIKRGARFSSGSGREDFNVSWSKDGMYRATFNDKSPSKLLDYEGIMELIGNTPMKLLNVSGYFVSELLESRGIPKENVIIGKSIISLPFDCRIGSWTLPNGVKVIIREFDGMNKLKEDMNSFLSELYQIIA